VLKVSGDRLDDYYDTFRYGWKSFETARLVTTPTKVRIVPSASGSSRCG
jgi:hypothetical protein